ncbi:MAG: DNA cytosine methyltransferase [Clostridium sp.]|jgi:DNA (cytosine-5)-methyltransferase 1|uniref:DNA cytosine methyltransferase n=1 Tax=Clostridium sp. TaxID=1506 RepID=UPI0025B929FA|nr:DNA cytosine methyltransferase [Clostridium sp.]MCH3962965.1 DNA cytosine methyltransferase [Clostridium sp.]MCI1800174.1 DNA cytosine methyltransferase [Clostridium sp.]MCI2200169.1 DNA cytosine methyltransferase [Clostridium sp.]
MLTHFSLFTGIGGIDLAAEWAGFKTIGQCEFADYPTKVLEKHWPDVPKWRDVRDVTAESVREKGIRDITVLSAGFPCQPHSVAGKHKASGDERNLWPETAERIRILKPKWFLGENVPGLLSSEDGRFFGGILRDMAKMGYSVGWCCYGANRVGAPHKRERIFIIAYSNSNGLQRVEDSGSIKESRENGKKQFERFYKEFLCDSYSVPEFQAYTGIDTVRKKRDSWEGTSRKYRRKASRTYWEISESPVLGVDDGIPNRVDRSIALGNTVVPQQVYPILKAVADAENLINSR